MNRNKTIVIAGALIAAASVTALAWNQKTPMRTGKVTPWAAMSTAEKDFGGHAIQALYEFDEGHWNYGVIVIKNHKMYEVDINPMTGKMGDTEEGTPADEAKETQDDLTAALKKG